MNYSRYYERIMKKLYSQVKKVYERIHVTHNNQKWFWKSWEPCICFTGQHSHLFTQSSLFLILFFFVIPYPSSPFPSPLNCIPTTHPLTSLLSLSLSLVSITFLPFFILKFPRFHSFSNSRYCLLYNSYDIGPKNQV